MKIKIFLVFSLVLFVSLLFAKKKVNNIFYAQNTLGGFKNSPQSAEDKAKLLKSIGYEGLEGFGYQDFFELKKELDKEDLQMPVNYVALNFENNKKPENPSVDQIKEMIKGSSKGSVVYFHLHSKSYKDNREIGDTVVAGILRDLSDFASDFNVKLSVYPHVSFYCETLGHSAKLAKMVNRKNYGSVLNLCHLLKVEGPDGIEDKIKEFAPLLFAVNICGADDGNTRQLGWDRLIQPLGEGSFDTYKLIKLLIDNGYKGPFGLQCYNLKGDAKETLTKSMQIWNSYKKRYMQEK